jgi:hypothetical protein
MGTVAKYLTPFEKLTFAQLAKTFFSLSGTWKLATASRIMECGSILAWIPW